MVLNLFALLLMLLAFANPSTELEAMRRSGDADAERVSALLDQGLSTLTGGTRAEAGRDAFLRGELYRRADALAPGQGYAEKALEVFRTMRLDYVDLSAGQLGYIGEARVYRQLGDPQEALASLAPLLNSRDDSKIRRLAQLEALEAHLLIDPRQALMQAGEVGESADWVRARAYQALGDAESALKYSRSESAVSAAPGFDRLKLIAELDALDEAESAAWAQALAAVGRVDDALAVLDRAAPNGTTRLYAALLQEVGRHREAAERWHEVYEAESDFAALFAHAQSLEALADQAGPEEAAAYNRQAIDAYRHIVESDADDQLRRDAFRRWFYLSGVDAQRDLIEAQADLIATDPYLRYARVRVMWESMDPPDLLAELSDIADQAEEPSLRALSLLMRAEHEADPRNALTILNDSWDLLVAQPATAEVARNQRVKRWIELGMIDRAAEEVMADTGAQSADTLLRVASTLAGRYADNVQGDAQARVIELAGAAMARAPTDEAVALRAAELLLLVDARNDAVRVLSSLASPEAGIVLARALRGLGRPGDALDRLKEIQTPEAALERSLCLADLKRLDEALAQARAARSQASAGGDLWWRSTIALVRTHLAMGGSSAAADVLRISEALYPVADRPRLMAELDLLKKELQE